MPSLSATAECGVKSLVMEKLKIQRKRLNSIEQARRQRRRHTWSTGLVRWSASSSTYLRDLQPKCVAEQSHKRLHTQSSRNPSPLVQTSARPTPVVHRKVLSNPASLGSQLTSKVKGRSKARNKQHSKDLHTEPAVQLDTESGPRGCSTTETTSSFEAEHKQQLLAFIAACYPATRKAVVTSMKFCSLGKQLGTGSFGKVFLGSHKSL